MSFMNHMPHSVGSFQNCTPSLSHFWVIKSCLMPSRASLTVTWMVEAEKWIMPPVNAWDPATEPCPRPTSSPNAVAELLYAKRYCIFRYSWNCEMLWKQCNVCTINNIIYSIIMSIYSVGKIIIWSPADFVSNQISIWSPSKTWLSTWCRNPCWQAQRLDVSCSWGVCTHLRRDFGPLLFTDPF